MGFEFYQKKIDTKVKDILVAGYLKEYIYSIYSDTNKSNYMDIISCFTNASVGDLNWDLLCTQVNQIDRGQKQLVGFYKFLLANNVYIGEFTEYLKKNIWILNFQDLSVAAYGKVFFPNSNPLNIYIYKPKNKIMVLYLNIRSNELRNIIIDFLEWREKERNWENPLQSFVERFEESLNGLIFLESVSYNTFNHETFEAQYAFYKNNQLNKYDTINLKNFYVFLIERFENQEFDYQVFPINCGIDKNFLYRFDFYNLYEEGYRIIHMNKSDNLPTEDRWLLNPNGYESKTTAIKSLEYIPIDFARVKNIEMKNELKEWFMYSSYSLKTLKNAISNIFMFFEFIESEEIKKIRTNVISFYQETGSRKMKFNSLLSEDNILLYQEHIRHEYDSINTVNTKLSSIRLFLRHIDGKGQYNLNPKIFEYLKIKIVRKSRGKVIVKEDLEKIVQKLKDDYANGDIMDKLTWIFLYILLTTNFRPNEILSLTRDCIVETMKTGDYTIALEQKEKMKMKTKTSYGHQVEINPTEYTIRLIKEAIKLTEELIQEAPNEIKKYIFIYRSRKGGIEPIKLDKFYRKFKLITGDLGLEGAPYTIYDCRHTYMTTLFEQAMKEGKLEKALIASGHKDFTTTMKHYVKPDIKNYLEAFHKVKIDNVDITGKIVNSIEEAGIVVPDDIREITVKNGCGFCKGNCSINENIDCLICHNFVVTIDRIPFFEQSIKKIDDAIMNEEISHEKDHLVSIKKLYVGYLASLYTSKNQKEIV